MSDTVFSILKRRLDERKSSIELFLAQGGAKSYDEYLRSVGMYAATNESLQDIQEIEKRFLED